MAAMTKHFDYITAIGRGKFDAILGSLRLASFVLKGDSKLLAPSYSSTIGKTIFLAHDWWAWKFVDQCANLCHEGKHLKQFEAYTLPGYFARYAFPWGRLAIEKEAYREQIRFWIYSGTIIPNFRIMQDSYAAARQNVACRGIVSNLRSGYLMKPNESSLWSWIIETVAAIYAEA